MQFNEKVLTALEVLKDAAENDFEKHRIEVLIQDLTTPPKVEIIDDKHQSFNGITFTKKGGGHFATAISIQRYIWQYYNGEIHTDDTYDVHHKNLIKSDNDISNLQLLTKSEHQKLHNALARKSQICPVCGKEFTPKSPSDKRIFCSQKCRGISLRKKPVEKVCPVCGKVFVAHQQRPRQVCCSCSCSAKLRCKKLGLALLKEKTCPVCGKNFVPNNRNQLCCSKSCAMKRRHAN